MPCCAMLCDPDATPVSDYLCGGSGEPEVQARTCSVPCAQPCLVSGWSQWSDCLPDRCRVERSQPRDGMRQVYFMAQRHVQLTNNYLDHWSL